MKFKKKPVVIEAEQYLRDENIGKCLDFCKEMQYNPETNEYYIKTLEGDMLVSKYDWIIKGVNGEFYPCKPDIFEKTYEQLNDIICEPAPENISHKEKCLIEKIEKGREEAINILNTLVRESCTYKKEDLELYKVIRDQIIKEIKTTSMPEEIIVTCSSPQIKKINVVTLFNRRGVGMLVHLDCVKSEKLFKSLSNWVNYIVEDALDYTVENSFFNYDGSILINVNRK